MYENERNMMTDDKIKRDTIRLILQVFDEDMIVFVMKHIAEGKLLCSDITKYNKLNPEDKILNTEQYIAAFNSEGNIVRNNIIATLYHYSIIDSNEDTSYFFSNIDKLINKGLGNKLIGLLRYGLHRAQVERAVVHLMAGKDNLIKYYINYNMDNLTHANRCCYILFNLADKLDHSKIDIKAMDKYMDDIWDIYNHCLYGTLSDDRLISYIYLVSDIEIEKRKTYNRTEEENE